KQSLVNFTRRKTEFSKKLQISAKKKSGYKMVTKHFCAELTKTGCCFSLTFPKKTSIITTTLKKGRVRAAFARRSIEK
ncbi:MAG: hypothetical protein K2G32_06420, partial [Oscillospiraceae bacterium]|nr:hypothetical protein [Oscillospiraceae bacterium]